MNPRKIYSMTLEKPRNGHLHLDSQEKTVILFFMMLVLSFNYLKY